MCSFPSQASSESDVEPIVHHSEILEFELDVVAEGNFTGLSSLGRYGECRRDSELQEG